MYGQNLVPSIWSKNFGDSFISEAFHLAKQIDPGCKMYINDFHVESNGSKALGLYNLVKKLKSQGVPIDGVGLQSHFLDGAIPKDFAKMIQWFVTLGVEVAVTELDVSAKSDSKADLETQAKNFASVYKACEDVKQCVSVTVWGTSDKFSWKKNGKSCLYDANFNPRPAVGAVAAILH